MKRIILSAFAAISMFAQAENTPVDLVNPLMGTDSSYELSAGNTYPAIARPWGMNAWTPQTGKMGDGWQYTYSAHKIRGLKQTHQPSPWINDYGQFTIMATTGEPQFDEEQRASWFSHKSETVKPYYYSAYLADWDVLAEVTPTERAAVLRFTFPATQQSNLIIDAMDGGSEVNIDAQRGVITGRSVKNSGGVAEGFACHFVVQIEKPFTIAYQQKGDHQGAIVQIATHKGEQVIVRVASSFISLEQAWQNLKEVNGSFEEVKEAGRKAWNEVLSRVEIPETESIDHRRCFYSCLYRSLLFPRRLWEVTNDGQILHRSPYNGQICEGYLYTDTGFWDTFRALFPLLNLLYPSENEHIQAGLVNAYKESGFLPEWASPGHRGCMVGNNSASVVADAYLKGLRGYDIETLWQAIEHGTQAVHPDVSSTGRLGYDYYNRLGYVPCDVGINESAARTLEYVYDDWCIYQLGKALGKPENTIKQYKLRAQNYRNLFSKEYNLMRGKNADGSWQEPFNPLKWGDVFTEGNAWHYTWSVFHDIPGLIQLMGGNEKFTQMLDSVFNIPPLFDDSYYGFPIHEIREMQIMNMGNYAHGNQPIQHMIYLYNYAGQQWKTQQRVHEVMDRFYQPTPDGYCGDEDNGQTSAWYVFSAMGFYPVCPASNEYVVGAPYFSTIILHPERGNTLTIQRTNNSIAHGWEIDGQQQDRWFLNHQQLLKAHNIQFK